jgi:hypothetical protein
LRELTPDGPACRTRGITFIPLLFKAGGLSGPTEWEGLKVDAGGGGERATQNIVDADETEPWAHRLDETDQ